ncbi:transcription factor castor (protein ming) [Anopheles darlingi]|uniref:Transcription factor castor (Protein ming) n=1 Tax=Anopheles darlingi TaxID=43151 RepID=W5J475_ANODA|nr:transcription factor castor (protein ming) [Anopheles darlingi]
MMSPESNGEPEPVAGALFRGRTPQADHRSCSPVTPGGKRMRFTDGGGDEGCNSTTNPLVVTEALNYSAAELLKAFGYGVVGSEPAAKRSISRQGVHHDGAVGSASEDEMMGDDQRRSRRQSCDPESVSGITGSTDARQAAGDRSGSSNSSTSSNSNSSSSSSSSSSCPTVIYGLADSGAKCDTLNNNNNSLVSGNHSIHGASGASGGGADGDASCDNNNSIKEMDDGKFSEFSKFLADSEKDESMATILELLHGFSIASGSIAVIGAMVRNDSVRCGSRTTNDEECVNMSSKTTRKKLAHLLADALDRPTPIAITPYLVGKRLGQEDSAQISARATCSGSWRLRSGLMPVRRAGALSSSVNRCLNRGGYEVEGRSGQSLLLAHHNGFVLEDRLYQSTCAVDLCNHAHNYGLIQRYASGYDCKHDKCQYESLHEHFHCHDTFCRGKLLYKKYEIIRHLKWHKKRQESLKYGFYRFSSSDDCSIQYGACQHNFKHTHYHCVHENCDKVYISTSDVQMHANYHRKHEAIVKNGFQRFRATEDCNTEYCAFRHQRTTHFHCRRENCKYTFKNKADMEKHKTYHLKDEMLLRDGYKKFLKSEDCTYKDCRFSRVCNHIHCMHENCHYVLHSSGQLLSHKRKHERMDTEVDYRRFQMARSLLNKLNGSSKAEEAEPAPSKSRASTGTPDTTTLHDDSSISPGPSSAPSSVTATVTTEAPPKNPFLELLSVMAEITFRALPLQMMYHMRLQLLQNMSYEHVFAPENVEMLRGLSLMGSFEESYLHQMYGGAMMATGTPISNLHNPQVPSAISGVERGAVGVKRKYKPEETGADQPETFTVDGPLYMKKESLSTTPPRSKLLSNPSVDYRLLKREDSGSVGCTTSIPTTTPTSSRRSPLEGGVTDRDRALLETANFLQFSSSKTLFNRKRGRPRKNHVMEVYNNVQDSPQAIFTSFKLEKSDCKLTGDVPPSTISAPMEGLTAPKEAERIADLRLGARTPSSGRSETIPEASNPMHPPSLPPYVPGSYLGPPPTMNNLGGLDSAGIFGNFSQLLERHMREVKQEPVATITQSSIDRREKARNHLKCVVCENLFETFADIKNHECRGDRAALEKPLLAFPPAPPAYAGPPMMDYSRASAMMVGVPHLSAPHPVKDATSLVKTAGTFFPDVNANKLKYS